MAHIHHTFLILRFSITKKIMMQVDQNLSMRKENSRTSADAFLKTP